MLDEYGEWRDEDGHDGRLSVPVSIALILFSALILWAAIYGAISEI